jgi:hypothetical protein
LQGYEEDAHAQRFSFRIAERMKRKQQFSGDDLGYTSPREYKNAVRTLEEKIHKNEIEIEKIKEKKSDLKKQIHRLQYLVLSKDADIRFFKRANIQLKTQKEDLQQQAFNLKYSL